MSSPKVAGMVADILLPLAAGQELLRPNKATPSGNKDGWGEVEGNPAL